MTTNTILSPTPIYDRVSAALGFNPVPGQPVLHSGPTRAKKKRPESIVTRQAAHPQVIQGPPEVQA